MERCTHQETRYAGKRIIDNIRYKIYICENPGCRMELPVVDKDEEE